MASPSAKYSKSARNITSANTNATTMVEAQSTRLTTTGINTAAVATLFQVMKDKSPVLVPEHYITLRGENIKGQISAGKKGEEILTVQSSATELKASEKKNQDPPSK